VHYYIYEFGTEDGDTGACIVEIQSDVVEAPPGPEFREVTLDELHQLGYLSFDEHMAQVPSVSPQIYTPGRIYFSWAYTYQRNNKFRCSSGSVTQTEFDEFIKVYKVYAERKKYDKSSGELKSTLSDVDFDLNGPRVVVYWDLGHGGRFRYRYHQHGWHYWIDPDEPKTESDAWAEDP
jgi:hypothetical protein